MKSNLQVLIDDLERPVARMSDLSAYVPCSMRQLIYAAAIEAGCSYNADRALSRSSLRQLHGRPC